MTDDKDDEEKNKLMNFLDKLRDMPEEEMAKHVVISDDSEVTPLCYEVVQELFGSEVLFMSDESSLWDFSPDMTEAERWARVEEVYNLTQEDIGSSFIVHIAQAVERSRNVQ